MATSADNRQATRDPWDIGFGGVVLVFATVALTVWFPHDIKGGIIVLNSVGKPEPGDAFFPAILAGLMAILASCYLAIALLASRPQPPASRLTGDNLLFLAGFSVIVGSGLALMYWTGPWVVSALHGLGVIDEGEYRHLVDTVPYKYLGYIVGGFLMTMALTIWAEGGFTRRAMVSVVLVLVASVVIFDVLLNNVQLPPNADY